MSWRLACARTRATAALGTSRKRAVKPKAPPPSRFRKRMTAPRQFACHGLHWVRIQLRSRVVVIRHKPVNLWPCGVLERPAPAAENEIEHPLPNPPEPRKHRTFLPSFAPLRALPITHKPHMELYVDSVYHGISAKPRLLCHQITALFCQCQVGTRHHFHRAAVFRGRAQGQPAASLTLGAPRRADPVRERFPGYCISRLHGATRRESRPLCGE